MSGQMADFLTEAGDHSDDVAATQMAGGFVTLLSLKPDLLIYCAA